MRKNGRRFSAMTERVINTDALQAYFMTALRTKQVRVRERAGGFFVEPVSTIPDDEAELQQTREKYKCPLLGIVQGGSLTVDKFLEMKRAEKELELENEKRLFS
jgi:hypothetical protein